MNNPTRFYEPIFEDSYQIFELQHIFGVSRRTVYKVIHDYHITKQYCHIGRRRTVVKRSELLKLVGSKFFARYLRRLTNTEVRLGMKIPNELKMSRREVVLLKTPEQMSKDRLLNLSLTDIYKAISAGLIPVVDINYSVFITRGCIRKLGGI